ncbi:MAG: nickel-binding protein [Candidatus Limnocylindrales bacterium]
MPHVSDQPDPTVAARYVAERYWPGLTLKRLEEGEIELRRASAALAREGRAVRYLGTTFIAAEETAFAVFEAADPAWVAEVNRRAGQPFDRIVPLVDLRESERSPRTPRPATGHQARR